MAHNSFKFGKLCPSFSLIKRLHLKKSSRQKTKVKRKSLMKSDEVYRDNYENLLLRHAFFFVRPTEYTKMTLKKKNKNHSSLEVP